MIYTLFEAAMRNQPHYHLFLSRDTSHFYHFHLLRNGRTLIDSPAYATEDDARRAAYADLATATYYYSDRASFRVTERPQPIKQSHPQYTKYTQTGSNLNPAPAARKEPHPPPSISDLL